MTSQEGRLGHGRQPSRPAGGTEPAPNAGPGWRAVSIVLVGAFMALLDGTVRVLLYEFAQVRGLKKRRKRVLARHLATPHTAGQGTASR
jgi:hypothetical protein